MAGFVCAVGSATRGGISNTLGRRGLMALRGCRCWPRAFTERPPQFRRAAVRNALRVSLVIAAVGALAALLGSLTPVRGYVSPDMTVPGHAVEAGWR